MKKVALVLFVVLAALLFASCSTMMPVAGATGTVGRKTGEASQAFVFSFPLKGEGGVAQAAKNGGITKVGTVDIRVDWPASPAIPYFIVTTVVTGE
ncbi:hypothetical protein E4O05_02000 [Treponema sp. OMZ 787]|uniref:TRL-like family protein n=1 Tax=Treponema sp. OMZ 787 TaxID=2563669 RepID=UPI0020A48546|nr:TRL-like family protein [Treponema sp. OMZ 787]UTC62695.1 hypothetical protein E4O05_02000 [Treponema sp. OMZ 787]